MALVKSAMLIDGENLVFRYQAMIENGFKARKCVSHIKDKFVWATEIEKLWTSDFYRVSYYTSCAGDEIAVDDLKRQISSISYEMKGLHESYFGRIKITPHVYKKRKSSTKSRLVDINICIDAMRYACATSTEVITILSGDGDFCELVRELQRQGKKVCVGAFSSGLEKELTYIPDSFISLDDLFFEDSQQ